MAATAAGEEQRGAGGVFDFEPIATLATDAVLGRSSRSAESSGMPGNRQRFTAGDLKGRSHYSAPARMADPVVGTRPATWAAPCFD